MRGDALKERGLHAAGRIAAKTGARLVYDFLFPLVQRGAGRVRVKRIPPLAEAAIEFLRDIELLILVGSNPPVSLFGSPDQPSLLAPEGCRTICLASDYEDGIASLEALADALGSPRVPMGVAEVALEKPQGGSTLTSLTVAHIVAYHLPGDAIVVDDSTSSSFPLQKHMASTWPHDHLFAAGGSIGWGIAAAVGAAAACPTRKVICLTGDGAGAMAMQALWTQAHEQLDVVTVVYSNRAYSILRVEWTRAGLGNSAPDSYSV